MQEAFSYRFVCSSLHHNLCSKHNAKTMRKQHQTPLLVRFEDMKDSAQERNYFA